MTEQTSTPTDRREDDVTGFNCGYNYFAQSLFFRSGYVVRPGDSLSAIALRVYGNAAMWPAIYAANADQIGNPNLIYPGQALRLP
jgi:nucleoid-associated protein YgaU